ncbi:U3 small nucleolar RNA-associated protein 25 [Patellaria atrata CBS 101060]|uniref:U3 small nucleolar RNA-associated protein 25 n=1 Tax=Patellaria atrata CBS 101060 TaxID=1346257 RepID=A0A9P4SDX6_9PEZI|nr:U3 small nucleolar RNA-associated protein 25 [Patellaria atrata CBS 101060]
MAPIHRKSSHNTGRIAKRQKKSFPRRDNFQKSRIEDPEQEVEDTASPTRAEEEEDELSSSEESGGEEEVIEPPTKAYNLLLQLFQQSSRSTRPPKKKRRLNDDDVREDRSSASTPDATHDDDFEEGHNQDSSFDEGAPDPNDVENVNENEQEAIEDQLLDNEDEDAADPFESHFSPTMEQLNLKVKDVQANKWASHKIQIGSLGKASISLAGDTAPPSKRNIRSLDDLKLKRRIIDPAQKSIGELDKVQVAVTPHLFDYKDILFAGRTVSNGRNLRKVACLHALNHLFKTRDRILKNTARLSREQEETDLELRDQGFTRPKILMLLETKEACVHAVNIITELCDPEQQENKKRFQDTFANVDDGKLFEAKPEDFRELFEGNDNNEYKLGLKFTRKTIKFFSKFYNSDIIFASPLGLRRTIETVDPKTKKQDSDFLSSIELVIVDQADAMLMQNWDHVEYIFSHLNQQPKEAHGCDFSRVRSWYLDNNAKYLRQTVILSAYLTPELNSLFSRYCHNVAGKVKYQPEYDGAIVHLPLQVKQTFSRYDSPNPVADPDSRFKYFCTAILPGLTRLPKPAEGGQGILIFIPSYHDFVRVRNHFATSTQTENISFGAISEYTDVPDVRRARSHFLTGRHAVLLYSGRAHHFRRYRVRGVKKVVMYAVPDNPIFYEEIVGGFLGETVAEGKTDPSEVSLRAMFSRWDGLRMERIIGTKRVNGMVKDKRGDTFDFI